MPQYELTDITNPIKKAIKEKSLVLDVFSLNVEKIVIDRQGEKINNTYRCAWFKIVTSQEQISSWQQFQNICIGLEEPSLIFRNKKVIEHKKIEALELLQFLNLPTQMQEEFSPWLENKWAYEFNVNKRLYSVSLMADTCCAIINDSGDIFYPGNKSEQEYLNYSNFICTSLRASMKEGIALAAAKILLPLIEAKTAVLQERLKLKQVLVLAPNSMHRLDRSQEIKKQKI